MYTYICIVSKDRFKVTPLSGKSFVRHVLKMAEKRLGKIDGFACVGI